MVAVECIIEVLCVSDQVNSKMGAVRLLNQHQIKFFVQELIRPFLFILERLNLRNLTEVTWRLLNISVLNVNQKLSKKDPVKLPHVLVVFYS